MNTPKYSEEALAFWSLFKALKPRVEKEVRDMIINNELSDADNDFTVHMMTDLSLRSFAHFWDSAEDDKWNDFIKLRLRV